MVARTNISINDGEPTPVAHVFTPDGDVTEGLARFINRNASVPAASEILTVFVRRSAASNRDIQSPGQVASPNVAEFKIKYPATYTDSSTGLVLIDYVDEAIMSFKRHPRSSKQRGDNLRCMAQLLLGVGTAVNAIEDNEPVW